MEALATQQRAQAGSIGLAARQRLPAIGTFTLGFAPVLYLALKGGGYDRVIYSQAGLAAWWVVMCGVLVGALPVARIGRTAWLLLGVLAAFATWTALGTGWSSDAEQSFAELGRVCAYGGFFVLALCVVDSSRMRHLLNGVGAAVGIVGVLAVLSRLHPQWFGADQIAVFFGHSSRLDYPLNYADGLGEFLALGIPLLLGLSVRARTPLGSALAAAGLPVLALGITLSISRGGVIAAAVGLLALIVLLPDRAPALASAAIAACASAIAIAWLLAHRALREGLSTPAAASQRSHLVLLMAVLCAGMALAQAAVWLWARFAVRPSWLALSRPATIRAFAACGVAAAIALLAAGAPGWASREWRAFQQPNQTGVSASNPYSRLGTVSGSHRYQYWQAALAAFQTDEARGIGPGTFEFWWAQHNSVSEFVRNAHSLYLETLAELGYVGLALLGGFVLAIVLLGAARTMRAPPAIRHPLATATAAFLVFAVSAAYDWVWQLTVIPVAALLLAGAVAAGARRPWVASRRRRLATRAVTGCMAVGALVLTALPMIETSAIRSSQSQARAGHLGAALQDARSAESLEPFAATPPLQSALVLELEHDYPAAAKLVREATAKAPTDWQMWLVRSRIETEDGNPRGGLAAYRRARQLNPTSTLFAR